MTYTLLNEKRVRMMWDDVHAILRSSVHTDVRLKISFGIIGKIWRPRNSPVENVCLSILRENMNK